MDHLRTTLSCLILLASPAAFAGEADPVRWRCWYVGEPQPVIACRLLEAPAAPDAADSDPLWQRLPGIVPELRATPGAFTDQLLHVPLHAPPMDMKQVARLAQATLCGSRRGCLAEFGHAP